MAGRRAHASVRIPLVSPASSASEAVLVAALRQGDRTAFEQVFRAHYDALCAFVTHYVARADVAEELVQDVFVWLWDHRADWEPRDSVRTYLYGAARNQALNHARRRKVEQQWAEQVTAEPSDIEAPDIGMSQTPAASDELTHMRDLERAVARAIQELPPRRREVYVLRRQHGLSQIETARAMGVGVKCVEVQFGKALQSLRLALARYL